MPLGEAVKGFSRGFRTGFTGVSGAQQEAEQANLGILQDKQALVRTQLANALDIQDESRMQDMAVDLRKVNFFMKNKQFDQALSLLQNRRQLIVDQKKDPKQTDDFIAKIQGGDQSVLDDLATAETGFVLGGMLDPINDQQREAIGQMAKKAQYEKLYETEGGGLLGVTKEGVTADIDLPEGVKIRAKTNPYEDAMIQLQIEGAKLKQQQLKGQLEDKEAARMQSKIDDKESAYNELTKSTTMIGTMDDLLAGDVLEQAAGWQAALPTVPGSPVAGFEAQLETMKSQLFLKGVNQLKGMGALSEAEGRKIADAVGSLDISMGDKLLRKEITRIRNDMRRAVKITENKIRSGKFKLPEGYVPIADEIQPTNVGRFTVEVE